MVTYYVRTDGNNGNAGTGAAAGSAWQTVTKALGATGIASGDTVYIAPGVYREAVTVAMTSATGETFVLGDPTAAQFSDIAPGDVRITAYTTNDTTAPAASAVLAIQDRDYLTFRNITFQGGATANGGITCTAGSTNITFEDCTILTGYRVSGTGNICNIVNSAGVAMNWTFRRCVFFNPTTYCVALSGAKHTGDYDIAVLFENCMLYAATRAISLGTTGSGAGLPYGVDVYNCTLFGAGIRIPTAGTWATSSPCTVYNCVIISDADGLYAADSGNITADYNYIWALTPHTNVTPGANSNYDGSKGLLVRSQPKGKVGWDRHPFLTPLVGSPLLNWGSSGSVSLTTDILNRPRPAGSGLGASAGVSKAVGALERHDTAAVETTTTQAGSNAVKIVGPGDADFYIPVDAASTTISVYGRYDTTHAATNKPQAILLANDEIGYSGQTLTMTAAVDTWEQLTFTPFTPSEKGVVTLRLVSRSAGGAGVAYFDTVAAT